MKIFISWSTDTSRSVASALKRFLEDIAPSWQPWVSHRDISAGAVWREELFRALKSAQFAILCIGQRTLHSPWVLFEAGALSALLQPGRMCPYLVDTELSDLRGPLSNLQGRRASKEGTWDLLAALKDSFPDSGLSDRMLKQRFEKHWPTLDASIAAAHLQAPPASRGPNYNRLDEDGLDKLLQIHFAASAARLSNVIEQAVDESDEHGRLNFDLMIINLKRIVREGRLLLTPFYSDLVGDISAFLDECLPPEELEQRLRRGVEVTAKLRDKSKFMRAAYQLIQDDQVRLMSVIRDRLAKRSSGQR